MDSLLQKLRRFDQTIQERATLVACGYLAALPMVAGLYGFFPFPLSRIGSVVLMVALAYMIGRTRAASPPAQGAEAAIFAERLRRELGKIDAQISLFQSALYPLPFVVGANLFWMGLPGPGTMEQKALLDCLFLTGTVLIFAVLYLLNQKTVRRELVPLRKELEAWLVLKPA